MVRWLSRLFDPDASGRAGAPGRAGAGGDATPQGTAPADGLPAMEARVQGLVREINASAGSLPAEGVVLARRVTDLAEEILRHGRASDLTIHTRIELNALLEDYLPTTLRTYVGAVRSGAANRAADQLVEQLTALRDSVEETVVALRGEEARALEIQGAFLSTKFAGSDL